MQRLILSLFIACPLLYSCTPAEEDNPMKIRNDTSAIREISRKYIHPDFNFTAEDLIERIPDLPDAALENSQAFMNLVSAMLEVEPWRLSLVDKRHPLNSNFAPPEIVMLNAYPEIRLGRTDLTLDSNAAEALALMSASAKKNGVSLLVSSAYRSWDYQNNLFARYAAKDGEEAASRYSARPGHSQHQLGTTVDFGDITNGFAVQKAGLWIARNGAEFGWTLSYPENGEKLTGYMWESWHWRYVGIDAAIMQERFFDGSQQLMLEFWTQNNELLRLAKE